ncbi:hypothetical protein FHU41_000208 [Psychromicrobium silvestre]|uniref:Uncharacterized protein n=1 Tax=Psychromicrobium silvestre TaxID=1645614 RepID=A0A7Y9LQZ8_9MICC|nr:hypothetical protein [Psychromicrobium silvestre]NYE93987.1 hypothetical protein [Psychromicrobium silvestre]
MATSTSSVPAAAQFFSSQSKALDEKQPTAQAAFTKEGTGPGTIDVPALPVGKTRIGLVINCTEGVDWKVAIPQKTAANAGAPCSEGITPIADFAIDSPKGVTKLELSLSSSTTYWLTVYYV